jgi:drug/metabolite transporter (DMT)-like permease
MEKTKEKSSYLAYVYLTITFFAWGSLYVVSKFVLGSVPVLTVAFMRYVIAGGILFLVLRTRPNRKIAREDYKYIFLIGTLGYFMSMGSQLLGTKLANASLASLINSLNPLSIILFAAIFLGEKITVRKVISILMALTGVVIILGNVSSEGHKAGVLFSVLSVVLWSLITILVRKISSKYDPLAITTYGMMVAAAWTLPIAAYDVLIARQAAFSGPVVLGLVYMGVFCTALAYYLWNRSLSMIEAGKCGLFYPMQPMVSAFLGWMFLGEEITQRFVIGAALIISGVMFSIFEKSKVPQDGEV